MARYRVTLVTSASTAVDVEVPDGATPEDIVAAAKEQDTPSLCHQCAGGARGGPELELGDDWDVPDYQTVENFIHALGA